MSIFTFRESMPLKMWLFQIDVGRMANGADAKQSDLSLNCLSSQTCHDPIFIGSLGVLLYLLPFLLQPSG